jgi:hypothetical protein
MNQNKHLNRLDYFFSEIPALKPGIDYFQDIEIQEAYEVSSSSSKKGLSREQVSALAIDALEAALLPSRQGQASGKPNRKLH